jgi:hypothetical protein
MKHNADIGLFKEPSLLIYGINIAYRMAERIYGSKHIGTNFTPEIPLQCPVSNRFKAGRYFPTNLTSLPPSGDFNPALKHFKFKVGT